MAVGWKSIRAPLMGGLQWIEHPIGGALSDAICFLLWMCLMVNAILMAVVQVALLDCRKRLMSGLVIIYILGNRIISHKTYGKTYTNGGSNATRNPHVVSVCPKARNPHVVSDCQPSNPPSPAPAGTNTHYPRTRHQRRVNFKLGVGVKHSVATWGIRTRIRIGCGNYLKTTSPPSRGMLNGSRTCGPSPNRVYYGRMTISDSLLYFFSLK
ncbi:hypothetical protein YC2023_053552 [Brassica napus]